MAQTAEGRASTKNGAKRMIFTVLSMVLEVTLIIMLFTELNKYAEWINIGTRVFATLLVLGIYAQHKTSSMKMPWIILILVFPVLGVALYLLIGLNRGPKDMRKRFETIDSELMPMLPENKEEALALKKEMPAAAGISEYIKTRSGYPVYQNTDITYYDDASPALEALLEALRGAKEFIFMEYHAIEDASAWRRIEAVLRERAHSGVDVRVFYDDMGSIGFVNTDFAKKLTKEGIPCRVFNPFKPGFNMFLNNRDHRKITVVDGRTGFTGGYNLADEYFNITHPFGQWKDTGVRLEGDAVKSLTATFLEMWYAGSKDEWSREDLEKHLVTVPYEAQQKGFVQPYADSPMGEERLGEEIYISIAEKAERYCWFITPYLILTDEMTHALSLAAKRGVDVRIITPGIPDKKMVYDVTRSFYNGLARNGVRIYEWTPGFCHCKMVVADSKMAVCGTINLDYRSLYHHFENGCLMMDCGAVTDIRDDMIRTFAQSTEVTEKYSNDRTAALRLRQMFMRLFAELM